MKRIGQILVEHNLLNNGDLEKALRAQELTEHRQPIGEILVDMGYITLDVLMDYLDIQLSNRA